MTPEQLIRPEILALSAYHVADATGLVKLDAMENPYRLPEALRWELGGLLADAPINRYPDPRGRELQQALRRAFGFPAEQDILLGNGSDELIQMIAQTVAAPGRTILAPEPTFVMYRLIAQVTGMRFVGVPLRDDFALDTDALLEAVGREQPAVVFLAYPNNPTGNLFDAEAVRRILVEAPGLVIVDEAYAAFASDSFMGALGSQPNLLVLRTVSKMGLAGLRLGLLAGPPAWLNEIDKTRLPYNINVLTQASAEFALEHRAVLDEQTARIRADRAVLFAALQALPGLTVYPSEANFILFRTPAGRADDVFAGLRERGVLIKNLHGAGGALRDCLRVTVGAPAENTAFLEALRALL